MITQRFIKWFADTTIEDIPIVGGKNALLGEMFRELAGKGVKVPNVGTPGMVIIPNYSSVEQIQSTLTLTILER